MGTHPIFESDFDCLTYKKKMVEVTAGGDQITKVKDDLVKDVTQKIENVKLEEKTESNKTEKSEKPKIRVVTRGISGKIKWFNIPHGYGFIERADNEPDVFVHQSAVVRPGKKPRFSLYLKGGEAVEFDVVQGLKGLEAAAVTAPGGYELGVHLNHHAKHRHYRNRKPHFNRKNNQQVKATKQDENANPVVVDEQPVKKEEKTEKAA